MTNFENERGHEFLMNYPTNEKMIAQLWRTIWRRKLLAVSIFLLVVISGLIATLLITPKYEAGMSVIVSRNVVDPQITAGERTPDVSPADITDEEFNSELELFKNGEVVAGAVRELDKNQSPANNNRFAAIRQNLKLKLYRAFGGSAPDDEIELSEAATEKTVVRVLNNLDVEPVKKSRVFKVTFTDTDPARAKLTLEKIYQKYVELHVRMNGKAPATAVFGAESAAYEKKLNAATAALQRFDRVNGITAAETGGRDGLLLQQVYASRSQADAAQTEINETIERVRLLKEKIAAQPEQLQTGSTSKYVPALDRMKDDLVQLNQQKAQLLQKYKPNARFVTEVEERIQNLKRQMTLETNNPPQEKSFALNDLRRRLESELANAEISLTALRTRQRDLSSQAAQLRGEAARLNGKSIEREKLERERKINEEAFLLYQKKARENEVGQVLNRQQGLNFSIIDPPRADWEPKSPKLLLNFLVLLGLGAIAGFAAAIIADKLFPVDKNPSVSPLRGFDWIYRLPQLADNSKDIIIEASPAVQSPPAKTPPVLTRTFAENQDDEKLLEISRYFDSKRNSK